MTGPLAYISAVFPLGSETFVYREVRELRRRGWSVQTVSLNQPSSSAEVKDQDLLAQRIVLYGPGKFSTLRGAAAEILTHPVASLRTVARAGMDALFPGEPTPLTTRVKIPAQAIAALGLARQLRRSGIAHIHCHFAHAPTTIGMYAARQLGIRFSFTGHANDLFQRRALLKKKLGRAAFVACISQWHRAWYEQIESDGRYEVIRCGVDVERWNSAGRGAKAGESALKVLTVCRLVEKKGVATLIRAAADLHSRGVAVEATIAGDGPDRPRLAALAAELKCGPWLRWLGAVDNVRVPQLLAEADVFALPCADDARGDRDGIPVVLMEAMACGVPVVSGDLPAIRELIDNGVSGWLVPGRDHGALAEKLAALAADPMLRQRLADAGRMRVAEEFSLALNVDRLERQLRDA